MVNRRLVVRDGIVGGAGESEIEVVVEDEADEAAAAGRTENVSRTLERSCQM